MGGEATEEPEELARRCLNDGLTPIATIKIVRESGLTLQEAKEIVHRCLPPELRQSAESLWDAAEEAAATDD